MSDHFGSQARLWELLVESRTGVVPEAALLKWHGMQSGGSGATGGALMYSPFRHMQLTCPTLMEAVETASAAEGADALVDPHGLWPMEDGSRLNSSNQSESTTSCPTVSASVSESGALSPAKGSTPLHVAVDEDSSLTVEFPAAVSASREFALFGACGHARGNALIPNSGATVHWRTAERDSIVNL
jgi:hypothetical protein